MVLKAKHIVEEINGTRCTIVEKGATAARVEFLKNLLEFNQFEVLVAEEASVSKAPVGDAPVGEAVATEDAPKLFTIGVTDLVFNPVIAVYEMSLKTPDGQRVAPAYWNQYTTESKDQYWEFKK